MKKIDREQNENENFKKCFTYFDRLFFSKNPGVKFWIAGGALRDFFNKRKISDFDVFFPDEENLLKMRKNMIDGGFEIVFENENCIKLKSEKGMCVDLVKKFFSSPEETIDAFDFTVTCCAIKNGEIIHHDDFFMDLSSRSLVINNLPKPISTFRRLQKYHKKGFTICNGGIASISRAINGLDLDNPQENEMEFYPDGSHRILSFD